jgi:hypothetical protein
MQKLTVLNGFDISQSKIDGILYPIYLKVYNEFREEVEYYLFEKLDNFNSLKRYDEITIDYKWSIDDTPDTPQEEIDNRAWLEQVGDCGVYEGFGHIEIIDEETYYDDMYMLLHDAEDFEKCKQSFVKERNGDIQNV